MYCILISESHRPRHYCPIVIDNSSRPRARRRCYPRHPKLLVCVDTASVATLYTLGYRSMLRRLFVSSHLHYCNSLLFNFSGVFRRYKTL